MWGGDRQNFGDGIARANHVGKRIAVERLQESPKRVVKNGSEGFRRQSRHTLGERLMGLNGRFAGTRFHLPNLLGKSGQNVGPAAALDDDFDQLEAAARTCRAMQRSVEFGMAARANALAAEMGRDRGELPVLEVVASEIRI
jgi:hypothetical protein